MTLGVALALLVGGLLAGFLTGLLGVGGGAIMVPLLYQIGLYTGADSKTAFVSAVATSLAVIIVSGAFAARIHHRSGLLEVRLLAWTGVGTLIGGIAGSQILIAADDAIVRVSFGIFLWVLAAAMFVPPTQRHSHLSPAGFKAGLVATGAAMAMSAALFGIGGTTLVVPALVVFFGVTIHRAVATATALIVMTALVGAAAYFVYGEASEQPYIDPLAVLLLLPGALIATRLGISLAMRFSRQRLRYAMVALQLALGARFIFF
jgi:uncharacterized membrane protein YfcA